MKPLLEGLRGLAARRPIARMLRWPPLERVIATTLRSSVVHERARFIFRELVRQEQLREYRLRQGGRCIFIRHRTPDVVTLDEVFYRRDYDLPLDVLDDLKSLGRPPVAVDLGANIGLFGVFFLERFPDGRVIAVEADAENVEVLRRAAAANGGGSRWEIVPAAAAVAEGTVRFVSGGYSLSRVGQKGDSIPAVDVFRYLRGADLLKLDIEGSEWAILRDERLAGSAVQAIVLEYHPYLCPVPDAREAATDALLRAGFEVSPLHHYEHGHGMLWGRRPRGA